MFTPKDFPQSENDIVLDRLGFNQIEECSRAVALAGFPSGAQAIDIATGGGRMAFCLAAAGFRTRSGDIDKETLEKARKKFAFMAGAAPEFFEMDACAMPFADGTVAALASANAVHEMPEPERMLAECARVLMPGALALIMDFNELGFDTIDRVHEEIHGRKHRRGALGEKEITAALLPLFGSVEKKDLALNRVWLCRKA